jgi:hypothetical protein
MLARLCSHLNLTRPDLLEPPADLTGLTRIELTHALVDIEMIKESLQGFSPATREAIAQILAERENKIRRALSI